MYRDTPGRQQGFVSRLLSLTIEPLRRWLRALYFWTLHWAESSHSLLALFLIAVAESSFFPIPPDVLLIAIVTARPSAWLRATVTCAGGSLLGAAVGYAIGAMFLVNIGDQIISFYGAESQWDHFVVLAQVWGAWFLAAAAFTPIPFKVATIASGAVDVPFFQFLAISLIGRTARFLIVATILRFFGGQIRRTIEKHFDLVSIVFFALLLGGFLILWNF